MRLVLSLFSIYVCIAAPVVFAIDQFIMWSPMFEFCMVPYGLPFSGATVDDWVALGESSELRLIDEGDSAVYINHGDGSNAACTSNAAQYVKIGVESSMARYSHNRAHRNVVFDDLMLREIPFQNAVVKVKVVHVPSENIRELECLLEGYGIIHAFTYPANSWLRAFSLRDAILTALRSHGRASCNTRIVLIRAGTNEAIKLSALVWTPSDFGRTRAEAKSLQMLCWSTMIFAK